MSFIFKDNRKNGSHSIMVNVNELVRVLLKNCLIILLTSLLFAGMGFFYSTKMLVPLFTAHFSAYINNNSGANTVQSLSSNDTAARESLTLTYAEIIRSRTIIEAALRDSGLDYRYDQISTLVRSSANSETQIIDVSVSLNNPQDAYRLAIAMAHVAPSYMAEIVEGSSMKIVEEPVLPVKHAYPNVTKMTILGAALGAIAASVLILAADLFNNKVRSAKDLEKQIDYSIIGVIPRIDK